MRLDDLARQAADQAREQAARAGNLDPEAYRGSRQRRTQRRGLLVAGTFVTAALVVAIVVSPPEEDLAAPTTTSIPGVPSTTAPSVTTTTIGPEPSFAPPPLGAGWEELDPGPIAGRYRTAAVWTDFGLFVWGGHDGFSQEAPSTGFRQDGYLYDPETGVWREVASPPESLCLLSTPRAIWLGSTVFVHGVPGASRGCGRAALYDPVDDAWQVLDFAFPSAIGPETTLAWTGDLLVAPTLGIAYDVAADRAVEIPERPFGLVGDLVHSRPRAHWTGSEVLVIGSGSVYAWAPGLTEWRAVDGPPVPDRARDSVLTDDGLLVVNYQMATALLDPHTGVWSRSGDLPLRFSECSPDALAVGGTPVVRMCSGLAIWDEVRSSWIPVPLGRMSGSPEWGWSDLVAGDEEIFSLGGGFLRYAIERATDGSVVPPPTVPIGVMQLEIPEGWDLWSSFAPVQAPEGLIPDDETIGLRFVTEGEEQRSCDVESTYVGDAWQPPTGFAEIGPIAADRPGRSPIVGTTYRFTSPPSDWGGTGLAFPDINGTDLVWVMCEGYSEQTLQDAQAFAAGLWSPWEEPPERGIVVEALGWEELYGGPVEGRANIAAVGTGTHIFVWGVGLESYLFDPSTETWFATSRPPPGFCLPTRTSVTWIDETVVVHGAGRSPDGCSRAVRYDPVTDTWTLLEAEYFDRVSYLDEAVWTGEWLAAPTRGLAWAASTGDTVDIPVVPEAGWSQARFHWTGGQIIALGLDDVYTLVPGEDEWSRLPGPPLPASGRDSVWAGDELFVIQYDNLAARFDLTRWEEINLPLRFWECNFPDLVVAGGLPVARACSGLAIWDDVRGFWVPIPLPMELGTTWWPILVGNDDAVYSFGERVLRYPIERLGDGSVANPTTIPVGVMQLDIPSGFWLRSTVGLTQTEWPDGSYGEVVAFAFEAPRGLCQVAARYGGPEIKVSAGVIVDGAEVPLPWFTYYDGEWDAWVIVVGGGVDSIWINCDSDADAELLIDGFWLP